MEEEIIELTDEVIEIPREGAGDNAAQLEENIIEFSEVEDKKEIEEQFSEQIDDDFAISIGIDDLLEKEISGKQEDVADSFADSLGMDLEPKIDVSEDINKEISLSPEHLEETLERVVKKMFSEKIEKMLSKMIEEAVSREIKIIKEKLRDI